MPRHLILLALTVTAVRVQAQSFIRVTDAANPVVTEAMSSGGAVWADFDGDGDLDLFVANGNVSDQANDLFLNTGAGTFAAVATGDIVTDGGSSIGGTTADLDGDGWLDLFVTNRALADETPTANFLYRGGSGATFTRVIEGAVASDVSDGNMAAWVDADADGDLDLFVTNFDEPDAFYRNEGGVLARTEIDGVTAAATLSIVGAWADFDNDGDSDYFRGNGGTEHDELFVNDGGLTFTRTAFTDGRATLGASWGDYDNDGDLDLFVAHFLDQDNALYVNGGPPGFELVPTDADPLTSDGGRSVGTAWGDYDNDGDLDLFVANTGQDNFLYENNGPPSYSFSRVVTGPVVSEGGTSFGTAWADYDGDGDLDLFVANQNGEPNFLYQNAQTDGGWLEVGLRGKAPNTTGLGARVTVRAEIGGAERVLIRDVLPQTGYNSQTLRLHFGLGDAAAVDELRVEWPSGTTDVQEDLDVNESIVLEEGFSTPVEEPPSVGGARLGAAFPNPATQALSIPVEMGEDGHVTVEIFDPAGRRVATLLDEHRPAGRHILMWDGQGDRGREVAPGVYVYRLVSEGAVLSRRLTLMH